MSVEKNINPNRTIIRGIKMTLPTSLTAFISFFVLCLLSACGGSGGSGNSGAAVPVATTSVNGVVFAGPVTGAVLTVKDQAGVTVAGPITVASADGSYQIAIPNSALAGSLVFEATGGSYPDEATGTASVPLGSFSAYVAPGSITAGANITLDASSTIVQKLVAGGRTLAAAQSVFSSAFGYVPDCSVAPVFANLSTNATQSSKLAGLRAAFFSQLAKDLSLAPGKQSEMVQALADDLSDGVLDGKKGSAPVLMVSGAALPEDIALRYAASVITFEGCANNKIKLTPDKIGAPPSGSLALTASYRVEYLAASGGDLTAKDSFQLKITRRSDGTPVTGLASGMVLTQLMVMTSMSSSSTWPNAVIESSVPGTYVATLYYSMATTGLEMYWKLSVAIGAETAVFYPRVAALPVGNTISAKLSSSTDPALTGNRTYRIWRDTVSHGVTGYDFTVFLSSTDSGNTLPVYAGALWSTPQLSLGSVTLQVSSDGSTWGPLTPVGNSGRYQVSRLSLTSGSARTLYLKLQINGNTYTTNGNLPDGNSDLTKSNAVAAFSVVP
jgi:hypothetical protein